MINSHSIIIPVYNSEKTLCTDGATNIGGFRSDYILLANLDTTHFDNIDNIGNLLYQNNKLLIKNSIVNSTISFYEDYPLTTIFLIEK
jgi:hypothetical protein